MKLHENMEDKLTEIKTNRVLTAISSLRREEIKTVPRYIRAC